MAQERRNNPGTLHKKNFIEESALKFGILMALALTAFFFFMKAIGLVEILELRGLNIIILFSFALLAIKNYKNKHNFQVTYFKGFGIGILTSMIGALLFSVFIFFYVNTLQPDFMTYIKNNEPFGQYLNPYLVAVTIFFEGTASGFLASYAIMQYHKTSHLKNAVDN